MRFGSIADLSGPTQRSAIPPMNIRPSKLEKILVGGAMNIISGSVLFGSKSATKLEDATSISMLRSGSGITSPHWELGTYSPSRMRPLISRISSPSKIRMSSPTSGVPTRGATDDDQSPAATRVVRDVSAVRLGMGFPSGNVCFPSHFGQLSTARIAGAGRTPFESCRHRRRIGLADYRPCGLSHRLLRSSPSRLR